jgi:16S rRNA (guanine966-N2)-methyltransferase
VREALFSILGDRVLGARVLDAFAGSGALGFEALSRGASSLLFVEADPQVLATLRENSRGLHVESRCSFVLGTAMEVLGGAPRRTFDLILADPPWADGVAAEFVAVAGPHLAPQGWLVVESDVRSESPPLEASGLRRHRTATYGRCRLDFYRSGELRRGG